MARPFLAVLPVMFICFSLSTGVASAQGPAPKEPAVAPAKVEAPKAPATVDTAASQPIDPKTYIIGPEDILAIFVWREPDFTRAVAVRPDGKITMPLINDIQAEGLTPERLAAQLTQALSEYINKPEITVSVNQVNSKKYSLSGQVGRPGQFPLVVPIRVGDALSAAGGFRDFANTKNIIIIRGDKRLKFNWNDYVKGKNSQQNVFLENGDTILVQ